MENTMSMQEMQAEYNKKQETIQRVREMFPDVAFPDVEEQLIAHYSRGDDISNATIMSGRKLLIGKFPGFEEEHEYGIISNRYQVVTHEETVANMVDTLENHPEFGQPVIHPRILNHGAKMRIVVDFPEAPTIDVTNNDPVTVRISGQNSYDLMWEYSVGVEGFCMVCSNGLMGWASLEKYNNRHNSGLAIDRSEQIISGALNAFSEQTEIWKLWANTKLGLTDFTEVISGLPFGVRHTEQIMELPQTQKKTTLRALGEKGKATLWDVNLSATQFLTHEVESEAVKIDKGREVSKYLHQIAKAA